MNRKIVIGNHHLEILRTDHHGDKCWGIFKQAGGKAPGIGAWLVRDTRMKFLRQWIEEQSKWVMFTKRTGDPKLKWLEITLARNGIPSRRNGESWHAPILEVLKIDEEAAWKILRPIDDIRDDHPRWTKPFGVNPSGRAGYSQWAIGSR